MLVAGGERAGKSFTSALYAIVRIPYGKLFWFVGPDYEQAQAEFKYTIEMLGQLGAIRSQRDVSMPKVGKWQAVLRSGQLLETKSADEVKKIASKAPDGIIMCEAAQHQYASYLRCVGRVAEKRGWLFMCGTFEGSEGWYPELFDEWALANNPDGGVSYSLASWENPFVYPLGRQDPEIQSLEIAYRRVPGMFEERCGAIPVPPIGLVFREFRHSVHVSSKAKFNPELPVYLAVDPSGGGAPYSVLACQFKECECSDKHPHDRMELCHVIDEVYETGMIGEDVMQLCLRKPWWKAVRGGAIDVEAPDEQKRWLSHTKKHLKSEKVPQLQGIRREKSFMHYSYDDKGQLADLPHLQINPDCSGLQTEYRQYKRHDPTDDALIPKEVPPSNQPNHSIKGLWYLLIARYGYVRGRKLPTVSRNRVKAVFRQVARVH